MVGVVLASPMVGVVLAPSAANSSMGWSDELAALGVDVGTLEADGLTIVVERAAEELRVRESAADKKSQLKEDVAEAGKLVARRQRDLEGAKKALAEWQENWAAALGDLGLAADTAAEAVDAQIGIVDQMRETAGRINSLRHDRIEKIQKDVADFEKVVGELVAVYDLHKQINLLVKTGHLQVRRYQGQSVDQPRCGRWPGRRRRWQEARFDHVWHGPLVRNVRLLR